MDTLFLAIGFLMMLLAAVRLRYRVDDFTAVASVVRGADHPLTPAWPVGMQEEDRDRPWGRATVRPPNPLPTKSEPEIPLDRVKPVIHLAD